MRLWVSEAFVDAPEALSFRKGFGTYFLGVGSYQKEIRLILGP